MLKIEIRKQFIKILNNLTDNGPKWKEGKDLQHLNKRKRRGHIPLDWGLEDYNQLIVDLAKELENDTYLYFKDTFEQRYLVIGDKCWIAVVGEDGLMETAFPPNHYTDYLSEDEGYIFLGTIKEVLSCEL